jgi:hypothetical protein
MYCSTCGVAVSEGLSYCNYCGAKLGGKVEVQARAAEVRPEMLVNAMVCTFIFGLAAIIGLMAVMKNLPDFDFGRIMAVTMLSFLFMLLLEVVFIWKLLRGKRSTQAAIDKARVSAQATKELDAAQPRALPEPLPSVTEHTTRAFEPVFRERTSKDLA